MSEADEILARHERNKWAGDKNEEHEGQSWREGMPSVDDNRDLEKLPNYEI